MHREDGSEAVAAFGPKGAPKGGGGGRGVTLGRHHICGEDVVGAAACPSRPPVTGALVGRPEVLPKR
jgi:hypothetical protein